MLTLQEILLQNGFISRLLTQYGIPFSNTIGSVITFILTLIGIFLIGRIVLLPFISKILDRKKLDAHAKKPIRKLSVGLIIFIGISVAFGLAGFGSFLTSLATIAAAATLAIGFALQDIIKNFVSGIFIYIDRPFKIGDWIEWDNFNGIVEDISLRVTRVRTFDNELLTVPNSKLTEDVVKNPVAKDKLRMKFLFGIGYEDDIKQATDIIIKQAKKHPEIMDEPEPSVRLVELEDSYVGLQSRIWIDNPSRTDFVRIKGEYIQNVKQRFDEENIEIPFPQRTLSGQLDLQKQEHID